ncbi:MAG TPA: hypothetical protein DHU55_01210 [Blastocatellia bacterium]|jgi:hypothetical protein|nr:hypothetical protein [Blastocatellia bacterium]HCX28382.1 hypothetical protein [Blastocatellia bacterium]
MKRKTKRLNTGKPLNRRQFSSTNSNDKSSLANRKVARATSLMLRVGACLTLTIIVIQVFGDGTLLYSTNNNLMSTATGAGLYNNSAGLGLVNRWDTFAVFNAP